MGSLYLEIVQKTEHHTDDFYMAECTLDTRLDKTTVRIQLRSQPHPVSLPPVFTSHLELIWKRYLACLPNSRVFTERLRYTIDERTLMRGLGSRTEDLYQILNPVDSQKEAQNAHSIIFTVHRG
ncbi:hypothetical protein AVEN_152123-1 [Araneus ventricosus]|uniref:Uncharacterized protein n=1 Tax=Araneus ventricosus TaxID=182803 RepID=A0A4Y2IXN8_ARAVE|nr:hypothetical protein AVEN_152123-1 [Araneus ventricosus]